VLSLLRLSPREPAKPVAQALAQRGPPGAQLRAAGGSALQACVLLMASLLCLPQVSLRIWWEHNVLLICAIRSGDAVALGVVLMISRHTAIGYVISHDPQLRSDQWLCPLRTCRILNGEEMVTSCCHDKYGVRFGGSPTRAPCAA